MKRKITERFLVVRQKAGGLLGMTVVLLGMTALPAGAQVKDVLAGEGQPAVALNALAGGLAFARAHSAVASVNAWQQNRVGGRIFVLCPTSVSAANGGNCPFRQASIAGAPWEKAGAPLAYGAAAAETLAANYLTHRMRRSPRAWVRALAPALQLARIGYSAWVLQHNIRHRVSPPAPVITVSF